MFHFSEEDIMQPKSRLVPVPVPGNLFLQLYKKAKKENLTVQDILKDIIQNYMDTHNVKE